MGIFPIYFLPKEWRTAEGISDSYKVVAQKYPAAFHNLGSMYLLDKNNLQRAVSLFRQGIKLRDADSMLSFANLVERNLVAPANESEVPIELRRRAAERNDGYASDGDLIQQL